MRGQALWLSLQPVPLNDIARLTPTLPGCGRRYKSKGGRNETIAAARQITGGKKREKKTNEPTKNDVRDMFDEIDADGSGLLDRDETKALIVKLFPGISDAEFEIAFAKMDDDGSGEVDFDEFATWWKKELKEKGAELEARMTKVREEMKLKNMAMQLYNAGPDDDTSKLKANLANRAARLTKSTKEQVRCALLPRFMFPRTCFRRFNSQLTAHRECHAQR